MFLESVLDHIHKRAIANRWLRLLTTLIRALLALAFLPSGLTKVIGHRFTALPTTTSVGSFFEVFFQAQGYYRFVGIAQLLAAFLLLFPQTAALGAALYLPIVVNIFVITYSVGFSGTWVITGGMFLATIYLLCWDYDRWKSMLPGFAKELDPEARHSGLMTLALAGSAAMGMAGVALVHRAWLTHRPVLLPLLLVAVGGLLGLVAAVRYLRKSPVV